MKEKKALTLKNVTQVYFLMERKKLLMVLKAEYFQK